MLRTGMMILLASLALAACGHDRPIVVNTPPAANPPSTVVVPSTQPPTVVVPQQ
ncbi:MAG: hypothetical protein JO010_05525 [Alphaproteobacteria bacterium]|nr:hypothetical protein [Alphaproteobacteria bacterium]